MESKVIVITGPTCSGKSILAFTIAEQLKSEIISADSRQFYKYLNIGTAKPDDKTLKEIRHHFIDILNPDEDYNVSKFETESIKIIQKQNEKDKIPVVAGGSGLYIKALVDGIFNSVNTDKDYRNYLIRQKKLFGNQYLYDELKKVDTESAGKMLPQNWKRIIRALEVYHLTAETIGEHQRKHNRKISIHFFQFALDWDRSRLYARINNRVDEMIRQGLIEEVKQILKKGYSSESNSLNTVGYKEIISYLNSETTMEKAVELIKRNTRRYAKRQLTWFRKDKRIKWMRVKSQDDLKSTAEEIICEVKSK